MTLTFKKGDMFTEPAQAIVNTVNCVGVMGKGVALEFKHRWPDNFTQYKRLCDNKQMSPGRMFVFKNTNTLDTCEPQFLINFPTKNHWRTKSKMEYIIAGLDDFVVQLRTHRIHSVAMPPIGCGNGGLDWAEVKAVIEDKLSSVEDIDIMVFVPKEGSENQPVELAPAKMTYERAILLKALKDFEGYFGGNLTRITMQKLVYFLQALGVNYNLAFGRNLYGPYSEKLRKAFLALERQGLIKGFSSDDRKINVTTKAYTQADKYLNHSDSSAARVIIGRLDLLIEGYESPYGMELLSSVHYLACGENIRPAEKIIDAMRDWSERKGNDFSPELITAAYCRLEGDGLIN